MKTNFTFLLILLSPAFISAQGVYNAYFSDAEIISCPYNDSIEITAPEFWNVYQTLDGTWNGTIDSTKCISIEDQAWGQRIHLDQFDPAMPLFIKSEINDLEATRLIPDRIYRASLTIQTSEGTSLNLNEDCENELCTGSFIGIEIPDSLYQGTDLRKNRATFMNSNGFYSIDYCYPTEKFDTSYLDVFLMKITIDSTAGPDEWIELRFADNLEQWEIWGDYRIYDIVAPSWSYQDTSYEIGPMDISSGYQNFLLMYTDSTYPSSEYPSFIDARPFENQPAVQTINMTLDYEQTMVFQPFAYIRGGLVEGNDTLRHEFNLINNGAGFCMEEFIEVLFTDDNSYIHNAGDLNFHGQTSCVMFRNGGELKVTENVFLQYGDGGEGILALGKNARINLEKGSTLAIDNKVILLDIVDEFDEEIKVDLQPGSTLIFGKDAGILRAAGELGNQMINVYMNGGLIDDRELTETERAMIRRIYPEPAQQYYPEEDLFVFPNPAVEIINVRVNSKTEQVAMMEILTLNGKVLQRNPYTLYEGVSQLELFVSSLESGIYVLKLRTDAGILTQKFIKY